MPVDEYCCPAALVHDGKEWTVRLKNLNTGKWKTEKVALPVWRSTAGPSICVAPEAIEVALSRHRA